MPGKCTFFLASNKRGNGKLRGERQTVLMVFSIRSKQHIILSSILFAVRAQKLSLLGRNMPKPEELDTACLVYLLTGHLTVCIHSAFTETANDEWNTRTINVKQFLEKGRHVTRKLADNDLEMFYHFDLAWTDAAYFFQSLLHKNGNVDARKLKSKETSLQSKRKGTFAETDSKIAMLVQRLTNDVTHGIGKQHPNDWEEIANKYMWANAQLTHLPNILGLEQSMRAFRLLTLEASEFASSLHDEWKREEARRHNQEDE